MTSPKPNVSDGEIDVSRLAEIAVERIVAEITARADLRMGWDCYDADDHAEIKTAFFNPIFKALTAAASSRPAAPTGTGWKPETQKLIDDIQEMASRNGAAFIPDREKIAWFERAAMLAASPTPPDSPAGVVKALEPFAKIADDYDAAEVQRRKHHADEGRPAGPPLPNSYSISVSLGECRNARAALAGITRDGGGE